MISYPVMGLGQLVSERDPHEVALLAAEYAAFMLREQLEQEYPGEHIELPGLGLLPLLEKAQRTVTDLGAIGTFYLFILPWPPEITCPPGTYAIFMASTRRWKRGQQPLMDMINATVEEVIDREQWPREIITIDRAQATQPSLFFGYYVMVRARTNDDTGG